MYNIFEAKNIITNETAGIEELSQLRKYYGAKLASFQSESIQKIQVSSIADQIWQIAPPNVDEIRFQLKKLTEYNHTDEDQVRLPNVFLTFEYMFERPVSFER